MAALSDAELYAITQDAFGDLGTGVVNGMYQIAKRESGGNPGAVNQNAATRDDSHGLWQINIRPDANPQFASWDLSDPRVNAKAARILYDAAGPSPWSTYHPAEDAALFNNGGGGPDQAGLGGMATTPRPLVEMSSVRAPTYGTAAAAPTTPAAPPRAPNWKLLEPILRQGGGFGSAGTDSLSQPLIPPPDGGSIGTTPAGTSPLVPIPNAPIMGSEEWKKLLVPLGYGG